MAKTPYFTPAQIAAGLALLTPFQLYNLAVALSAALSAGGDSATTTLRRSSAIVALAA